MRGARLELAYGGLGARRANSRFPPRSDPNPPAGELRNCGGSCDGCSSWTGWYVGNLSKSEQHKACGKRATVVIASVIP